MFSLSKTPDTRRRVYEHNDTTITIIPSTLGHPTIWDKDVLIFCCSQLISGMRQDRELSRFVVFPAHYFLVTTNRSTSTRGYDLLTQALERLSGVRITTNIETGGEITRKGFGLIGEWEAKYSTREHSITYISIELSQWLYRAITSLEVLTIHRDYFRLDGGLERRVYELCRKHCGNQPAWSIGLELLHKKSGSRAPLRNFRIAVQKLTKANYLPGYRLRFDQGSDKVTAYTMGPKGSLREIRDVLERR
jgi:plasmid replication initiation protein